MPTDLPRRDFLKAVGTTVALAGCATAHPVPGGQPEPDRGRAAARRLLILGGTGFIGPAIVNAARARGHAVTLFNRGKTNPGLFPDVETIVGDRKTDLGRLSGRTWDAVLDTWTRYPSAVRQAAELLRDILLRADRATLADVQSQLTELRQQMNDRTRAAAELAPALNRALARNARETQDQMVAALYPIFFPLLRRAIRGWFERVVDDFKSLFG